MKRIILIILLSLAALTLYESKYSDELEYREQLSEWDLLTLALIQVESNGDSLAVGLTNDMGVLQITPVYVKDANRICGEQRYTLECRTSRSKSLEMFEIIQGHYNPERDIDKAIQLHNPGAGSWYAERVYSKMEELKQNLI